MSELTKKRLSLDIVSGPLQPWNTHVYDHDTGAELTHITKLSVTFDASNQQGAAVVNLELIDVDGSLKIYDAYANVTIVRYGNG